MKIGKSHSEDLDWGPIEWQVVEKYEGAEGSGVKELEIDDEPVDGILEGTAVLDEDHEDRYELLRYAVTDPFNLVGHNGISRNYEHEDGKRYVTAVESEERIRNRTPEMGLNFFPYLAPEHFNLPEARYRILPEAVFDVQFD